MNSSSISLRRLSWFAPLMFIAVLLVGLLSSTLSVDAAKSSATTATADLAITKTGDETAQLGGLITYTIGAYNAGPDDAVNVVVIDTIPAHTTFVSASVSNGSVSFDGTMVTAGFGTLAFDNSSTLTLVVRVDQDTPRGTTITNTADGTSSTPDNETTNNSATAPTAVTGPFDGDLLISEFRLIGPGGSNDEFIELYNNTGAPLTVTTTDETSGWAVAASDGIIRFTIPNGTTIPARGHFLGLNTIGNNSLRALRAGPVGVNQVVESGDATYSLDIPDNAGIAVFRTASSENFSLNTRLDAVGSTSEANTLYKEGTGYPALVAEADVDHAFVRDNCGKSGSISTFGPCPTQGFPRDTNNNATDFYFVDTNGTSAGAGQRLGAPGAEALADPIQGNDAVTFFSLDRTVASSNSPNRVRDLTSDPGNNSTFGTLDIRRRVTNTSGFPVTRLRFRIVDVTTFPAPSGIADLRPRTSTDITVDEIKDDVTCPGGATPCSVTVTGTTLEQPPSQPNGGGFNSSMSSDTITLATPLAVGDSINLHFLLGIQQTGSFKFYVNVELLIDQSEPVGEGLARKASRKLGRGQQRAAGAQAPAPTSIPRPVVQNAAPVVERRAVSESRIVAFLILNTPRDEAATRKSERKKKRRVKRVAKIVKRSGKAN